MAKRLVRRVQMGVNDKKAGEKGAKAGEKMQRVRKVQKVRVQGC